MYTSSVRTNDANPETKAETMTTYQVLSTDRVPNAHEVALYASICCSEKGYANEVVKVDGGYEVRSEQFDNGPGCFRILQS